ncbi:MAG: hypothetical protein R8K47_07050 [Mariprofundaceae bacterium]
MFKRSLLPIVSAAFAGLLLAACTGGMPKLFWDVDEGKDQPAYARGGASAGAPSRAPLDVPPELRTEIELPKGEDVGAQAAGPLPEKYRRSVAGEAVRLDARFYPDRTPAEVFSAVVDAMTALNVPVDSVDSPSGVITSDWVRKGSTSGVVLFGFGGGKMVRYRYVARVYKARSEKGEAGAQLEVRTLGQVFEAGKGWVNKRIKHKPVAEIFDAVGEQLARQAPKPATPETMPVAAPAS